jgi:HicA toxin of bacterial toxin-antitoxin,
MVLCVVHLGVLLVKDARTVIVPMHAELRVGTLQSILRQAGITQHQLRELL